MTGIGRSIAILRSHFLPASRHHRSDMKSGSAEIR
jgi:hypothetical protein